MLENDELTPNGIRSDHVDATPRSVRERYGTPVFKNQDVVIFRAQNDYALTEWARILGIPYPDLYDAMVKLVEKHCPAGMWVGYDPIVFSRRDFY
jgi:hypothetical protein